MNEHIELVKKWLEDNNSVSLEELATNVEAAWDAYENAMDAADAAYFAAWSAEHAAKGANSAAALRVKNYEELTNGK